MSPSLNHDRILEAATAYIEQFSPEALTMRKLGAYLGVEAMALYRHVAGKEQLLSGVVDKLTDDLLNDPRITEEAGSWEEYLHNVGHTMRDLALGHPHSFPLIATRPPEAPWLRPPLRSIRWVEHFLASLLKHGFTETQAVHSYKAFTGFLLGYLQLEAASQGSEVTPLGSGEESPEATESLRQCPTVLKLQDLLAEDHAERDFNDGLDDLIERLRHSDA